MTQYLIVQRKRIQHFDFQGVSDQKSISFLLLICRPIRFTPNKLKCFFKIAILWIGYKRLKDFIDNLHFMMAIITINSKWVEFWKHTLSIYVALISISQVLDVHLFVSVFFLCFLFWSCLTPLKTAWKIYSIYSLNVPQRGISNYFHQFNKLWCISYIRS